MKESRVWLRNHKSPFLRICQLCASGTRCQISSKWNIKGMIFLVKDKTTVQLYITPTDFFPLLYFQPLSEGLLFQSTKHASGKGLLFTSVTCNMLWSNISLHGISNRIPLLGTALDQWHSPLLYYMRKRRKKKPSLTGNLAGTNRTEWNQICSFVEISAELFSYSSANSLRV